MKRLLKQVDDRIDPIVDGRPVHNSGEARRFLDQHHPEFTES